jgi:hypothetical protein
MMPPYAECCDRRALYTPNSNERLIARSAAETSTAADRARSCLGVSGGGGHRAGNLAENNADACGNARHDRAGSDRNESRHQSVFNEVLSFGVFPDAKLPYQVSNTSHFVVLLFPAKFGCVLFLFEF